MTHIYVRFKVKPDLMLIRSKFKDNDRYITQRESNGQYAPLHLTDDNSIAYTQLPSKQTNLSQ